MKEKFRIWTATYIDIRSFAQFCRVRRLRNFGKKGAGGGDSFCGLLFFLILLTLVRDKKVRKG